MRVLVLDMDTRAGLCSARSLGRSGAVVVGAARDAGCAGLRSRHVAARVVLPRPEDDLGAYADAIVAAAREHGVRAILCSIDSSLAALRLRRAELDRAWVAHGLASEEALAVATSKERTLALAERLGV